MSSPAELLGILGDCERRIISTQLKAQEKVRAEEERAGQVEKKRQELCETHQQQLEEALAEHAAQMASILEKAEEEIAAAVEGKEKAKQRVIDAQAKALETERRAAEVEREVSQLYTRLESSLRLQEGRQQDLVAATENSVQQTREAVDHTVRCFSLLTAELQDSVLAKLDARPMASVEAWRREAPKAIQSEEAGTAVRSAKYKDVNSLVAARAAEEISEQDFETTRAFLLQDWYQEWLAQSRKLPASPGPPVKSAPVPLPLVDLKRPRSVDRVRHLAMQRITFGGGARSPGRSPGRLSSRASRSLSRG